MRIDATLSPQLTGLMASPGQTGQGPSFDSLFLAPQADDDESGVKAAPVLSQNVFGFNALGVLGLGGPAGVARRLSAVADNQDAGTAAAEAVPHHLPAAALRAQMQAGPASAAVPDAAASPDSGIKTPATPLPAPTAPPLSIRYAISPIGGYAAPSTPPPPALTPAGEGISRAAPANATTFSGFRALSFGLARTMQAPRKTAVLRFTPEVDPAPNEVSVTASEVDERLHIMAAAPELTDSDRQNLKTLAEETAAEAGVALGDLRLNGVVVRQLSKTR